MGGEARGGGGPVVCKCLHSVLPCFAFPTEWTCQDPIKHRCTCICLSVYPLAHPITVTIAQCHKSPITPVWFALAFVSSQVSFSMAAASACSVSTWRCTCEYMEVHVLRCRYIHRSPSVNKEYWTQGARWSTNFFAFRAEDLDGVNWSNVRLGRDQCKLQVVLVLPAS